MKNYRPISTNARKSAELRSQNSLDLNNIVEKIELDSDTFLYNHPLLETYLPTIIESGNTVNLNETATQYYYRPKKLSVALFNGLPDFWYLILACNGFRSTYEFKGFRTLIIPDERVVANIINEIEKR